MTGNVHYELLGTGQTITEYKKFIANNTSVSVMYDIINEYEEKWCHLLWIGNTSVSRTNLVCDGNVASFSIFTRFSDNRFFRLLGHFIRSRIRRYKKNGVTSGFLYIQNIRIYQWRGSTTQLYMLLVKITNGVVD